MRTRRKILTSSLTAGLVAFSLSGPVLAERNPCSPCAPKKKMQHEMKNPCAGKNPCAAKNPCGAKNPCAAMSPCAAKNPCAAKKY